MYVFITPLQGNLKGIGAGAAHRERERGLDPASGFSNPLRSGTIMEESSRRLRSSFSGGM